MKRPTKWKRGKCSILNSLDLAVYQFLTSKLKILQNETSIEKDRRWISNMDEFKSVDICMHASDRMNAFIEVK